MLRAACGLWLIALVLAPQGVPYRPSLHAEELADEARIGRHLSLFSHSNNCIACHNGLTTSVGEDVSIGSMWRASMMANSARDPYWQAAVRREMLDHPAAAAEIEDECAACHMPMPRRVAQAAGEKGAVFAHLPFDGRDESALDALAADGTSCTVCHQIAPDTLGTRESFNANFVMRPTPADGARLIFGPHVIDAGRKTIMRSATGFVQAEAPHIRQSELCASCHTLITRARGPDGNVIGALPEQMNYQEWLHSDFKTEQRSCQSCHMPAAPGPIRIASVLGDERDRLARHAFVGGNAHMVRVLNRYRAELGVVALPSELEATANATIRLLQEETASVALSVPKVDHDGLSFDVDVRNLAGHKFPTGYPSRRAWLHVTVRDDRGTTVFESGAIDTRGAIEGNDHDRDPLMFEPHYERVTGADQVQIYESIPGDPEGKPTTGLLTATQYLKDNRLLPRGFDKATADPEIAVHGDAARDASFIASGDRVHYLVAVPGPQRYIVHVELRFQSIGYRWAQNLETYSAPEPRRFLSYYEATVMDSSVVVATATGTADSTNAREAPPERLADERALSKSTCRAHAIAFR